MEMSEGAVKTQLSRARNSLKNTFLRIEKDQGICLRSVGIIPFVFFISYILMQQSPVSEAVGSTVKAGVLSSAAVKNAAESTLSAAGDVSQDRAVSESAKAAKAGAKAAKAGAAGAKKLQGFFRHGKGLYNRRKRCGGHRCGSNNSGGGYKK